MRVADRLAHELAHPVVTLAVLGLQTGNYERHLVCSCSGEGTREGSLEYRKVYLEAYRELQSLI